MVFMTNGPRLYVIKKAARPIIILNGGGKIPPRNKEAIDTIMLIHLIFGFFSIISCRRSLIILALPTAILIVAERGARVMFRPVFPHLGQGPVWSGGRGSWHHLQVVFEALVIASKNPL